MNIFGPSPEVFYFHIKEKNKLKLRAVQMSSANTQFFVWIKLLCNPNFRL